VLWTGALVVVGLAAARALPVWGAQLRHGRDLVYETPTLRTIELVRAGENPYDPSVYAAGRMWFTMYTPLYAYVVAPLQGLSSNPFLAELGVTLAAAAVIVDDAPRIVRDAAGSLPPLQAGIELGPGAWIGAALLAAAGVAVLRVARRRDPRALFAALAAPCIACEMACAGLLMPAFERQVQRPFLDAARIAALHAPATEAIVTFGLLRRASISFETGRGTEYWGGVLKTPQRWLPGSGRRHGVATRADFEEHLVPLGAVKLDDVRGYVVFRIEWGEPTPAAAADALLPAGGRE
jgi:hypothetical protein